MGTLAERIGDLPWGQVAEDLSASGWGRAGPLLTAEECAELVALYPDETRFRSHIQMQARRFGVGDYKYFKPPLPELVRDARAAFYPHLAALGNAWMSALGRPDHFPETLDAFLRQCGKAGQERSTPLLLRYQAGGFNCLHQDVYGSVAFPLQVVIPLSRVGVDYTGGEFVLVEQRPRAQSIARVIVAGQGEAVVFPNRFRPAKGPRGAHSVAVRHGLSVVAWGERYALGLIFHDAA